MPKLHAQPVQKVWFVPSTPIEVLLLMPTNPKGWTWSMTSQAIDLARAGESSAQIARRLGRPDHEVRAKLRRAGATK